MSDDYPDDQELERIRTWPASDPLGWLEFIKGQWWSADWGWHEYEGKDEYKRPLRIYHVSTGGWSGNEDRLDAMRENFLCWHQTFYSFRRGGHFEFRLESKDVPETP